LARPSDEGQPIVPIIAIAMRDSDDVDAEKTAAALCDSKEKVEAAERERGSIWKKATISG
jgi:hypothetical protein